MNGLLTRLIVRTALWLVAQAALLFGVAGTVRWPGAWVFLIESGVLGVAMGLSLARRDPALLAARLALPIQPGQPRWDRIFLACAAAVWLGWMALMALDAGRYRWSAVPVWLQAVGAVLIALGLQLVHRTFLANSYSAPAVKIQAERGHRVVTDGPYRHVRHPMYAGAIIHFVGTALLLGSWYGLALVPPLVAGLGVRIVFEERLLTVRLEGYAAYAARVRYRLIPGVW